jgi:1-acyl-sn-glycerol-3-phosphate acyltransferase
MARVSAAPDTYEALVEEGQAIHADIAVGHPGQGWMYWPFYTASQALRARWDIRVTGAENVGDGPAILVGNHLRAIDPLMVGMTNRWRLVFFAKADLWESKGAPFFHMTGQIPIRRGDEASTKWGLAMSAHVLEFGNKLCLYPESTRSPDGKSMHRLHRRVLVPVLQANPDVPVHAMTIAYLGKRRGRERVDLRFSPALPLDVETMSANELTETMTQALLDLGGMPYVHQFGRR